MQSAEEALTKEPELIELRSKVNELSEKSQTLCTDIQEKLNQMSSYNIIRFVTSVTSCLTFNLFRIEIEWHESRHSIGITTNCCRWKWRSIRTNCQTIFGQRTANRWIFGTIYGVEKNDALAKIEGGKNERTDSKGSIGKQWLQQLQQKFLSVPAVNWWWKCAVSSWHEYEYAHAGKLLNLFFMFLQKCKLINSVKVKLF